MEQLVYNKRIDVFTDFKITDEELEGYMKHIEREEGDLDMISSVSLKLNEPTGEVDILYDIVQPKFDRIRRITGYLAGTTDRWNNAKQAEERDREKHL